VVNNYSFAPLTCQSYSSFVNLKKARKLRHYFKPKVLRESWKNKCAPSRRFMAIYQEEKLDPVRPVAIYAHFNVTKSISNMVFKQLSELKKNGFQIIFVSMSDIKSVEEIEKLKSLTTHIIIRETFGWDFGAWRDIWLHYQDQFASFVSLEGELLLANDSVVGPLYPLKPLIEKMRTYEGLIGLTENSEYFPHLQSYFLLLRGQQALSTFTTFIKKLKLTNDKNSIIHDGELGLSRYFRQNSVNIYVAFPLIELHNRVLQNSLERRNFFISISGILGAEHSLTFSYPDLNKKMDEIVDLMRRWAGLQRLNPLQYFWKTLVEEMGFPFIKTELLLRNPTGVCNVNSWAELVGEDSPVTVKDITDHLHRVVR